MDKQDEGLKLLKEIRTINKMIDELQEHIDEIYTRLTSTTVKPKEVDVQSSGDPDPLGSNMAKILEYQEQVEKYHNELCMKRDIALKIVKQMDILYQQVIMLRYFKGLPVERVGEEIGYTYRWAWEKVHEAEMQFISIYEKST